MTAHKHAALMLQYAQDAMETDKPWERWEYNIPKEGVAVWYPFITTHPAWLPEGEYRRKPRTLTYTVTIPEPMREAPEIGTVYWLAELDFVEAFASRFEWKGDMADMLWLKRGLCFATREDAIAAAKAMMPFKENNHE